jgi:hypothetical protein
MEETKIFSGWKIWLPSFGKWQTIITVMYLAVFYAFIPRPFVAAGFAKVFVIAAVLIIVLGFILDRLFHIDDDAFFFSTNIALIAIWIAGVVAAGITKNGLGIMLIFSCFIPMAVGVLDASTQKLSIDKRTIKLFSVIQLVFMSLAILSIIPLE